MKSQNGWFAIEDSRDLRLRVWVIPAKDGVAKIRLRDGSAGFILAHLALWFSERVDPLHGRVLDEWGWAMRPIRGSQTTSNHASGTAMDLNATRHPLGRRGTFSRMLTARIRLRLAWYRGVVRWGGDYEHRADEMHFEIDRALPKCERVARMLMGTPRGKRLLAANPGAREAILS